MTLSPIALDEIRRADVQVNTVDDDEVWFLIEKGQCYVHDGTTMFGCEQTSIREVLKNLSGSDGLKWGAIYPEKGFVEYPLEITLWLELCYQSTEPLCDVIFPRDICRRFCALSARGIQTKLKNDSETVVLHVPTMTQGVYPMERRTK